MHDQKFRDEHVHCTAPYRAGAKPRADQNPAARGIPYNLAFNLIGVTA
jgi:hypothetical protein